MKRNCIVFFLFTFYTLVNAQVVSPWKRVPSSDFTLKNDAGATPSGKSKLLFYLDQEQLKTSLEVLSHKRKGDFVLIEFPNSNGDLEQFVVKELSNFAPELQEKYPEIRAFSGKSSGDKTAVIHFSFSPYGFQSMILRANSGSEFIEGYSIPQSIYNIFSSRDDESEARLICTSIESMAKPIRSLSSKTVSSNGMFKTLRLALACTGEYTAHFGGVPQALAAMNATMTRVNGVFNKDLALHLNLIPNTEILIYPNAATDPFSPANIGAQGAWNMQLQRDLSAKIGNSNYDIGHLLGASGGGGNAGCIGCVCNNPLSQNDLAKGSGYSSPSDGKPEGDTFDIDFVAHEIGHQLGANHTFSHEIEGTGVSVEPGSGSTIMGYAGLTDYNVQLYSDDYFSKISIEQILTTLSTRSCPAVTTLSNQTPTVNAGPDYVIPKSTPFYLKGTSTDPNGDSISYCWEQIDSAINTSGSSSVAFPTKENGPLFRSVYPSSSPIRFFPSFPNVLNSVLKSKWESVVDISRELNFALTVRDNALGNVAQTNSDNMKVQVDATTGPFELLSQSEPDLSWPASSFQTITWAVNNTIKLPGASHVNIKLSIDGGQTFPIVLKSNTPNDGSELIVVPKGIVGKNCRLLIEPLSSIFYAVNKESFAIGYSSVTTCSTYDFPTPFVIPESTTPLIRTISVPVNSTMVSDVNVKVELSHEYISDVQIELISPQRRIIKLLENKCGDTNNSLKLNFDDQGTELNCTSSLLQNVVPIDPLNVLNDSNPSGNWSIRARDMFSGDSGSIQSASVTICTKAFTPIAPFEIDLSSVLVYPNPNQGEFNVIFTSDQVAEKTIMVHDLLGRKIYEKQFPSTTIFYETIQLVNVQTGVYIVSVKDGSRQLTKKLVVE